MSRGTGTGADVRRSRHAIREITNVRAEISGHTLLTARFTLCEAGTAGTKIGASRDESAKDPVAEDERCFPFRVSLT